MTNNFVAYAIITLLAGIGIPIMASLNSGLGVKLQSPVLATTILFAVGLLIALSVLLLTEGVPQNPQFTSIPWYFFCGGVFVISYVLSVTWIIPKFGIANAISFVLLGQLISMTAIDHFGFFGVSQYSITSQRLLGLLFMSIGVFMVLNRDSSV